MFYDKRENISLQYFTVQGMPFYDEFLNESIH